MAQNTTARFIDGFEVFVTHDKKHFDSEISRIDEVKVYDYMDIIVRAQITYWKNGKVSTNVIYTDDFYGYGPDDIITFDGIIRAFFRDGYVK